MQGMCDAIRRRPFTFWQKKLVQKPTSPVDLESLIYRTMKLGKKKGKMDEIIQRNRLKSAKIKAILLLTFFAKILIRSLT